MELRDEAEDARIALDGDERDGREGGGCDVKVDVRERERGKIVETEREN